MLLYRALWSTEASAPVTSSHAAFAHWIAAKTHDQLDVPTIGRTRGKYETSYRGTTSSVSADIIVERAGSSSDEVSVLRMRLIENRDDGSRWETILRCWSEGQATTSSQWWIWVDIEAVGEGLDQTAVAAPALVTKWLSIPLSPVQVRYEGPEGGEQLAELLAMPNRDLACVVFADPDKDLRFDGSGIEAGIRKARDRSIGIATVTCVDRAAGLQLREALGPDYAVQPGDMRIYLPSLDPARPRDYWRHRYVRQRRLIQHPNVAGEEIARVAGLASSTRRPPASWTQAAQVLQATRDANTSESELLEIALDTNERLEQELSDVTAINLALQEEVSSSSLDLWIAGEERAELVEKLEQAEATIKRLRARLVAADVHDVYEGVTVQRNVPRTVFSCSEAAEAAQAYLEEFLVIPDEALRDLNVLDSVSNSAAWGQTSWRAFRALHAYATDIAAGESYGSFWTWCENSGNPHVWPASSKKLSMSESSTVENSESLRFARILPVSPQISPDGRIYMGAHMKIAEGGGPLAPRIYFHPDSASQKVHVGFFGPHKHMPNTKT